MLVLIVIYGIAPKIQEEKRPLLYIGSGITFILIVINIVIGIYITDKYCKKNDKFTWGNGRSGVGCRSSGLSAGAVTNAVGGLLVEGLPESPTWVHVE